MKMLIQTLFFPFLMIVVEAEEEAGNPMVYPKVRPIPLVAVAVAVAVEGNPKDRAKVRPILLAAEEEAGNPMVYPKVRPIPLVAVAVVADNPMIDVVVVVVVGNPMGHHGANDRRHHYHHPNAANAREDAGTPKYWAGSGNER